MDLRSKVLTTAYRLFPFSLKGDVELKDIKPGCDVSCVINFYGAIHLLEGILYSLAGQDLSKEGFEVILVEDRGGTVEGKEISEKFNTMLNIRYFTLPENYGIMGFLKNYGLSKTRGKYILFLDDDTVILQNDFISMLIKEFESTGADAVVPRGRASYCLLKGRYDFHDPYFPTNRCMAYKREVLRELAGFVSEVIGQEDVEFVIRFVAAGRRFHNSNILNYLHPPLIFNNLNKAMAVGKAFVLLRNRYPLVIWFMLLANGLRYLPLMFLPLKMKWRMQGKFSFGFLLGILYSMSGRKIEYR